MRIGEVLVDQGLIDRGQLKQALDAQLIYGGHLGTCLIELGFLTESQLGGVLAKTFGVPYASNAQFQSIQRFVIGKLPERIAEKHGAMPFGLEGKVLDVAMIDPKNLAAVDEIEFAAGCRVNVWVAPEARIFQALERYYGVPRRTRFVALCHMLDRDPADSVSFERLLRPENIISSPIARPEANPSVAVSVAERPAPAPHLVEEDPLADLTARLCRCDRRDQLAIAVLDYAARDLKRRILFKVIHGSAQVWQAQGAELPTDGPSEVLPIMGDPVFGLLRGQDHYVGKLGESPARLESYARLGLTPPTEVLLLPIYINDELVAMFYGDGGPDGRVRVDVAVYRRLMRKLGLGLQIELLRRRLQNV